MGILNLAEAALRFAAVEADLESAREPMIATACEMVAARSKSYLGEYQTGWAQLKPETIAHKATGESPLLETGEMRDSIEWNADRNHGFVGSNLDRAVFHECGTGRIPPRSFLALSAMEEGPAVAKMMSKVVGAAIGGRLAKGSRVSDLFELAHFVGHVLHAIKETAEDLLEEPDDQEKK